jgi:hypothetical protein
VRYADGPAVSSDVLVRADAARVWRLVSDIELPARFSPELREVRWVDGAAGPAVGARFEGVNENEFIGRWRTVSEIVELVEPHAFGWVVIDGYGLFGPPADPPVPVATWRYDLTPEGDAVRVRLGAVLGPGRSGVNVVIDRMPDREEAVIEYRLKDLRRGIDRTLEGIRDLAEQ